jgi:hypothetical protein
MVNQDIIVETDVQGLLIKRFSIEIDRLNGEVDSANEQRNQVTHFYKKEFSSLWNKFSQLEFEAHESMVNQTESSKSLDDKPSCLK